jgi:hypothetical protein
MDEFRACMDAESTVATLQAVIDEARVRGIQGTPALFFNGERPNCGDTGMNPNCEGNLGYDLVVQNIAQQLEAQGAE